MTGTDQPRIAEPADFPRIGPGYFLIRCLSCRDLMRPGDRISDRAMGAYFIHTACANGERR
ncbi:hypothetical protein [Rhodococcus jostii]|uniref:hypothetical protein n=1 Tax=Rhodococcus jostii TaxID=132919 RepID=UPI00362BC9A3